MVQNDRGSPGSSVPCVATGASIDELNAAIAASGLPFHFVANELEDLIQQLMREKGVTRERAQQMLDISRVTAAPPSQWPSAHRRPTGASEALRLEGQAAAAT
jgi:hypothetical protein